MSDEDRRYFEILLQVFGMIMLSRWPVTLWSDLLEPLGRNRTNHNLAKCFCIALIPIETDLIRWYEHDTNLNRDKILIIFASIDHLLISPRHNHVSEFLLPHQTLFVAKPGRYKNSDFLAIPQSWPLSLHILDILSYLLSFYHFHPLKHHDIINRVILACAAFFRAYRLSGSWDAGPQNNTPS